MIKPVIWQLTPDRAEEWRFIRLTALADAPYALGDRFAEWVDRPVSDFAIRLETGEIFAAGYAVGQPLSVASWQQGWTPGTEDMGWIMDVFTINAARQRGLSAALLAHIAARAKAAGMIRLGLHVGAENLPALQTYTRAGFTVVGEPFINDLGIQEVELQHRLA